MGNSKSQLEAEHLGYRVLGVQPNSPAAKGGLVSFFDFIVAANGIPLKSLDTTFIDLIKASEDKPLPLNVYNCKNHSVREVTLVPSRKWPGEGMLGVTIRFDSYFEAEENMCHVLEVEVNSPAELAGLQPHKDYLLGTAEKVFKDTDVLFEELQANIDKPVEFYVYNVDTDEVRIVVLMPTQDWGGEGILGANVAHGFLHVLPAHCCNTIGVSNEGSVNKVMNSPFGYNTGSAPVLAGSAAAAPAAPLPEVPAAGGAPTAVQPPSAPLQDLSGVGSGAVAPSSYLFKVDQIGASSAAPHLVHSNGSEGSSSSASSTAPPPMHTDSVAGGVQFYHVNNKPVAATN